MHTVFEHEYYEEAELRDRKVRRVGRMPALLTTDTHTHPALMNHTCS